MHQPNTFDDDHENFQTESYHIYPYQNNTTSKAC